MPRPPLLPLLRVAAISVLGLILLWGTRRRAPQREVVPPAVWATDISEAPAGSLRLGEKATGPLPGQKRPPCAPELEVAVADACWIPHAKAPPCPLGAYEGQGRCLVPVKAAQRPATSIQP